MELTRIKSHSKMIIKNCHYGIIVKKFHFISIVTVTIWFGKTVFFTKITKCHSYGGWTPNQLYRFSWNFVVLLSRSTYILYIYHICMYVYSSMVRMVQVTIISVFFSKLFVSIFCNITTLKNIHSSKFWLVRFSIYRVNFRKLHDWEKSMIRQNLKFKRFTEGVKINKLR